MNLKGHKKIKSTRLTGKEKAFILTTILVVIIAFIVLLQFKKVEIEKTEEADVIDIPGSGETRKELFSKQNERLAQNSVSFTEAKLISLQVQLLNKGQTLGALELAKVITLYNSDNQTEALAGLSTVTDELIKFNLSFLFPGSVKSARNNINIAAKRKIISKGERVYLIRLKEMTDLNCLPFETNDSVQIEKELQKGISIIENLI